MVTFPDYITLESLKCWDAEIKRKIENGYGLSLIIDTNTHNFESVECFKCLRQIFNAGPLDNSRYELMNIAVTPESQNQGIGSKLLNHAICSAKELGAKQLEVGTGSFGYQLGFYQKAGFRVSSIEKDFFLRHYNEPIFESGIQLKDMIRLSIEL